MMRDLKAIFSIIILFLLINNLSAYTSINGVIVLEGKYQNKNLYVQNSMASSGAGFCVFEILINGQTTTDPVNSSAFEIDFRSQMIEPGSHVVVQIKHKPGCTPKILNPDVLKPMPTFETLTIKVNQEGVINWTTKNETGSLPYVIEQYKWNKWVAVGEIDGKGKKDENSYAYKVPLISGENKFRVKQVGTNRKPRYSSETKLFAKAPKVNFTYNKSTRDINFDSDTSYEVYDKYGNLVKKGYGNLVNCANLEKSVHYLNFDNETVEINLK
jgi:hypothetical protein